VLFKAPGDGRSEEMFLLAKLLQTTTAAFLIMLIFIQGCSTLSSSVALPPAPQVVSPPSVKEVGEASWYGPSFNGKRTASGHTFDETKMTARLIELSPWEAKSKSPISIMANPSKLKLMIADVIRRAGSLDLSHAAAKALGIREDGTARVSIEPLDNSVAADGSTKP
jgi:rare lipoprotein A